jgi:hypothetical protein
MPIVSFLLPNYYPDTGIGFILQAQHARQSLVGILPYRKLDFEEVHVYGTEGSHIGAIGPTQD